MCTTELVCKFVQITNKQFVGIKKYLHDGVT